MGALSKLKNVEKSINKPRIKTEITKRNLLSIFIALLSKKYLKSFNLNIIY